MDDDESWIVTELEGSSRDKFIKLFFDDTFGWTKDNPPSGRKSNLAIPRCNDNSFVSQAISLTSIHASGHTHLAAPLPSLSQME